MFVVDCSYCKVPNGKRTHILADYIRDPVTSLKISHISLIILLTSWMASELEVREEASSYRSFIVMVVFFIIR